MSFSTCRRNHEEPNPRADPLPALGHPRRAVPIAARRGGGRLHRQRGAAHAGAPPARLDERAAVGRRCLHPGRGRAAAHAGQPGGPHRAAPDARRRPDRLRSGLGAGGDVHLGTRTRRQSSRDGDRRRRSHARNSLHLDQRLHRSRRAGQGHRHVVVGCRSRGRGRTDFGRLAPRAFRLGIDLHGEPADRRCRTRRRTPGRPTLGESSPSGSRPDRRPVVHGRHPCCRLRHHRGPVTWLVQPDHSGHRRRGRWRCS